MKMDYEHIKTKCHYKTAAKVCAYIAFWCAGMMVWYKLLLEGVR